MPIFWSSQKLGTTGHMSYLPTIFPLNPKDMGSYSRTFIAIMLAAKVSIKPYFHLYMGMAIPSLLTVAQLLNAMVQATSRAGFDMPCDIQSVTGGCSCFWMAALGSKHPKKECYSHRELP